MKMLRNLLVLTLVLFGGPVLAQVTPGTSPLTIAKGGTKCSAASGTCLDNITGFSGTGLINRTGSGTYAFAPLTGFITCPANQFVNVVGAASVCAQPAFSNLSGRATLAQLPQGIANSIWINPTAGTADMQNIAVPPCANDAQHALVYINGTGLQCSTHGTAAAVNVPISLTNGGLGGSQAAATAGQVPVFPGGGGAAVPTTFSPNGIVTNLLPNVQWQLWTTVPFSGGLQGKVTADGTAVQTPSTCASFTPVTSSTPVFTCANTGAIRANDFVVNSIVAFWGFAGVGYATCVSVNCINGFVTSAQVTAVVANTSITVQSPFEKPGAAVSPGASSSSTLLAIAPYGTTIYGPDGWNKTSTLIATVDDWGAAATPASTVYPGCERPLLLRKGVTGQETFTYNIATQDIPRWQGQTVTFGAAVYQRVQGGASTWNLHIDDSSGSNASSNGTGSGLGGYQFLTATRTIAANATSIAIYINLLGNAGDVFDVCLPTAAFTSSLAQSQLGQRYGEIIRANGHWNPPLMNSWHIDMPSTELVTGSGLYGYNGINLEAISLGIYHRSLGNIYCMLELVTPTAPPVILFTGARTSIVPGNNLSFGPRITTSTANIIVANGLSRWPVYHDGTITIFSNVLGLVMSVGSAAATFDCTDVEALAASSID